MILGKKDKNFVEGLKQNILDLTNDIGFLRSVNSSVIKNFVKTYNDYLSVASVDNLLNLSGLTIKELSNISGVNLEEFVDSDEPMTPELYNTILRALFKFFLENTGG